MQSISMTLAKPNLKILLKELLFVGTGIAFIAGMAQVAFPLPWTPVPITGQTFAVFVAAVLSGRRRGALIMTGYLGAGFLGLPVFAGGSVGMVGPTLGYLVGMWVGGIMVGHLADKKFFSSAAQVLFGWFLFSAVVFSFGLTVLSFFLPVKDIFWAGIIPFLPGDLIKAVLATLTLTGAKRFGFLG